MTPLESSVSDATIGSVTFGHLLDTESSTMLLESSSIMLLELSIMLLQNIYRTDITHDNRKMFILRAGKADWKGRYNTDDLYNLV